MRLTALLLAALFACSAALQLNDPDPKVWILAYGAVAALWALAAFGRFYKPATVILLLVLTSWMAMLVPDVVAWVRMGMPTIVGSMKAEAPHIELVREFGGLFLAAASLLYLLRAGRRPA